MVPFIPTVPLSVKPTEQEHVRDLPGNSPDQSDDEEIGREDKERKVKQDEVEVEKTVWSSNSDK